MGGHKELDPGEEKPWQEELDRCDWVQDLKQGNDPLLFGWAWKNHKALVRGRQMVRGRSNVTCEQEDKRLYWCKPTGQGWERPLEAGKGKETGSPWSLQRNRCCRHRCGLLTSRTAREWMCVVLSHQVCSHLLQQQKETYRKYLGNEELYHAAFCHYF